MIQTNLTEIPYTEFQRKQLGLPLYVVYSPMSIDVERYNIPRISRCGDTIIFQWKLMNNFQNL